VALPVGKSGMERGLRFGSHDDQAGLALDKLLKGWRSVDLLVC
jgi:hypothetical protein